MAEEPSNPACPEAERLQRLKAKIATEGFLLWTVPLCMVMAKTLERHEPTFLHWALMLGSAAAAGVSLYLARWVINRRGTRVERSHELTEAQRETHPCSRDHKLVERET